MPFELKITLFLIKITIFVPLFTFCGTVPGPISCSVLGRNDVNSVLGWIQETCNVERAPPSGQNYTSSSRTFFFLVIVVQYVQFM